MPRILFRAIPTDDARHLQSGGADAYDAVPERRVSDGDGVPCRHCLRDVVAGEEYLVLAYRHAISSAVPQGYLKILAGISTLELFIFWPML